ncbi:MAG TPA: efflux transporter outer membrane subunit [Candidatus Omnitrophota bacterium]|nr:efflux transporter outer membrane subunit [Candidatus Omnitrophota bacterium]
MPNRNIDKKITLYRLFLGLLLVVALNGCIIGKNYQRPQVTVPGSWRIDEADARQVANAHWWEHFEDPVLNTLIQTALHQNLDLLRAASRVDEYLARYQEGRSDLFPQISGQAAGGRQRATKIGPVPLSPSIDPTSNNFLANINLSWEIDLWGKIRRLTEAARAEFLGMQEARNAVILSLVSGVASSYVHLLSLDRQLEISKATLQTRKDSVELFRSRFEGGLVSQVELLQVKSEYYATLALIPGIEASIAQQENALSVLLGQNPGPITRGKRFDELALPSIPAGLPSRVLEQRPDILQAEQQLVAANARIGAAQAHFFPAISLTGVLGTSSAELKNLFTGPAQTWNYIGSVAGPIFNAGKIQNQVRIAKAQRQEMLFNYFIAIQNAFREVNDALMAQHQTRDQLRSQEKQLESLKEYDALAWLRYDNGYTDYLEVLDAQRNLFAVQLACTQTKENLLHAMISLYKAMGGGWKNN